MKDNYTDHAINIIVAEDDADDQDLLREAFKESKFLHNVQFVEDGEQLMQYLKREGKYSDRKKYPDPGIVLLDLNMPKKDGREALKEIKSHPNLKRIPVIILSTSRSQQDILGAYDLGVNCFVSKPSTFTSLLEVTDTLRRHWFEMVELPPVHP